MLARQGLKRLAVDWYRGLKSRRRTRLKAYRDVFSALRVLQNQVNAKEEALSSSRGEYGRNFEWDPDVPQRAWETIQKSRGQVGNAFADAAVDLFRLIGMESQAIEDFRDGDRYAFERFEPDAHLELYMRLVGTVPGFVARNLCPGHGREMVLWRMSWPWRRWVRWRWRKELKKTQTERAARAKIMQEAWSQNRKKTLERSKSVNSLQAGEEARPGASSAA